MAQQLIDGRKTSAIKMAERELALDPGPTKLEDLLHVEASWWIQKFNQCLGSILGQAARRPEPVQIPDAATLRALIWNCQNGHDGTLDPSPAWRGLWSSDGETIQSYVRGLFAVCRSHNYPRPERYEPLVACLAEHIVAMHQAAAEQQLAYLAKLAEKKGPAARIAAAHAVEHAGPLQTALLAFDAATRDAGPSRWHETAHGLMHLEAAAKEALA